MINMPSFVLKLNFCLIFQFSSEKYYKQYLVYLVWMGPN
jgi:hypothetical protein